LIAHWQAEKNPTAWVGSWGKRDNSDWVKEETERREKRRGGKKKKKKRRKEGKKEEKERRRGLIFP
jgi:hypothetical protein